MTTALRPLFLACAFALVAAQAQTTSLKSLLPEATTIGNGSFRWFGLKVYDARLWADKRSFSGEQWMNSPLALELTYARSLVGAKIAEASVDEMKKLGLGSTDQRRAWLDAMKQVFPDVADGTRLTGIYQPGQPTRFLRDGETIGEIADPEFGAAFFAIWLHPKTTAPKLRAALLGKP